MTAGDPEAFSELLGVVFSAALVWGLLRLRRWARSLTLALSALGLVIAADGYDTAALARALTVVSILAALSVVLLRTASVKRAFGIG